MENHLLNDIEMKSVKFFMKYTNFDVNSKGYGLTIDTTNNLNKASIASTGFMLSSLIIAVKRNLITYDECVDIVKKTLNTLIKLDNYKGFFAHFYNIDTSTRYNLCEYSTIDTGICISGIIAVESFLDNEEVTSLSYKIINRIEFEHFCENVDGKTYLRMAYNPDYQGDYVIKDPGFISRWDMFAEQLLLYPIIAGLIENKQLANDLYLGFDRNIKKIKDIEFLITPHNTLFIYHLPLCFLDLRDYFDSEKINWVKNAVLATKSHQISSINSKDRFPSFSKNIFGMNASDTPDGYRVFGALPNIENKLDTDGTIAPFSIVGALPYLYEDAIIGIEKMNKINGLSNEYGFKDAYRFLQDSKWISSRIIAINKGLEMLSVNQLIDNIVRDSFMGSKIIKTGLKELQFNKIKG